MEKIRLDDGSYVLGNVPPDNGRIIYVHQSHKAEVSVLADLFRFAMEAYSSGYSLMVPMFRDTLSTVLEVAFIFDMPIHVVVNIDLDALKLGRRQRKVLLLRGGFISPSGTGKAGWVESMQRARLMAVEKSSATLVLDNDFQDIAGCALDMGKDVAVLRSTMSAPRIRKLVREGIPVLDSFSSWREFPDAISYESDDGPFVDPVSERRFSLFRF